MVRVKGGGASSSSPSPSQSLLHFSHPHHRLELIPLQSTGQIQTICSGCILPIRSPTLYACRPCNFFLDTTCSRLASLIKHPSHPQHPLSLRSSPAYTFACDACSIHSASGFTYHCPTCEFDLHCLCAALSFTVNRPNLHPHRLDLIYSSPYTDVTGFSCDVCRGQGSTQWLYRCDPCGFDVHLNCATGGPHLPPIWSPGNLQQQQQQRQERLLVDSRVDSSTPVSFEGSLQVQCNLGVSNSYDQQQVNQNLVDNNGNIRGDNDIGSNYDGQYDQSTGGNYNHVQSDHNGGNNYGDGDDYD